MLKGLRAYISITEKCEPRNKVQFSLDFFPAHFGARINSNCQYPTVFSGYCSAKRTDCAALSGFPRAKGTCIDGVRAFLSFPRAYQWTSKPFTLKMTVPHLSHKTTDINILSQQISWNSCGIFPRFPQIIRVKWLSRWFFLNQERYFWGTSIHLGILLEILMVGTKF